MDAYRKIAVARNDDDLGQIRSELTDLYGPMPDEVNLLLEMAELRIKASRRGIKSIVASGQDLVFSFDKEAEGQAEALLSKASGKLRIPEPNIAYLRLEKNYFEPRTLITILRKMLNR